MEFLYRSHKIRLEPNNKQLTQFRKHAGCARYAYNFALEIGEKVYAETGKSPSAIDIHKMFVRMEKSKYDWLYEVSKCCTQQGIRNYETSLKNFHRAQKVSGYSDKKPTKNKDENGKTIFVLKGLPQKKKKGKSADSFYLEKDGTTPFDTTKFAVRLPRIGMVRCSEELPQGVEIKNCVISRKADDWYISFRTKFTPTAHKNQGRVGVDVGIKNLATCSNGRVFESPKRLKQYEKKLKRLQRSQARMYEDWKAKNNGKPPKDFLSKSANYGEIVLEIARIHKKIADNRRDIIHKATTYLTKSHAQVVIEDLCVSGMMKNHHLAKAIANGSFFEIRRQLEYKGRWYGCEIITADRFFPSSKLCSCCGEKNKELKLSDRFWACKSCGAEHDRDLNAAINLERYPESDYAASFAVKARGERSSASERSLSMKREINIKLPLE